MVAATSGNEKGRTSHCNERSGVWEPVKKKRERKGRESVMGEDVMKTSLQRKINSKK